MIELKPCLFCGEEARLFVNDGVCVICSKCRSSTKVRIDSLSRLEKTGNATLSVIEAWNRRITDGKETEVN